MTKGPSVYQKKGLKLNAVMEANATAIKAETKKKQLPKIKKRLSTMLSLPKWVLVNHFFNRFFMRFNRERNVFFRMSGGHRIPVERFRVDAKIQ